jgi:succinate dehydrogenase/fumarate reductase cytochrome b subunit
MSSGQRTYVYLAALISGLALLVSAVVLADWVTGQWATGVLFPSDPGKVTQRPLSPWLWVGALSLVIWLIHATIAARAARQETAEGLADRHSSQRKAYLYLMQLAALIVCLAEGGRLVSDFLAFLPPGTELTPGRYHSGSAPDWRSGCGLGLAG